MSTEDVKDLTIISKIEEGKIVHNYEELRRKVAEMVKPYRGLVFTEENAKEGKETVAKLQKFHDDMDKERKNLKKAWMKPYESAEVLMKDVLNEVKEPIQEIRTQLSELGKKRIKDKWDEIFALKERILGENKTFQGYMDYIALCPWFDNPRWENSTFTMEKIEEEIKQKAQKVVDNCNVINQIDTAYKNALFVTYREMGDLTQVMLRKEQLEESYRATQKAQEATQPAVQQQEEVKQEEVKQEEKQTLEFRMRGTKSQFAALLRFCKDQGILVKKL
jgi:hypothetical protein